MWIEKEIPQKPVENPDMEIQINVLVVEDNPGDVFIVRELLNSSGLNFKIENAFTLKQAIGICSKNNFDIILLDLGLPDCVGLETLKQINSSNVTAPLIVMTGLDDEDTALAALREGAQDYLVKSRLTSENIFRTIRYSIERKKIQNLQRLYTLRFSILSAATASLNECDDTAAVFKIICSNFRVLLPDAGTMAFEFARPGTINVLGIEWLSPWFEKIRKITGIDLDHPVFPENDLTREILNSFKNKNLVRLDRELSDVLNGIINPQQGDLLSKLFDINYIYSIGLVQHKIFYGGFLLFARSVISDDDCKVIETIGNHTALNIHRRSIERDLRFSEEQYKVLNKELESKVKDRTKDLEDLNSRLQKELADRIEAEDKLKKSEAQLIELNNTKDKFFNIVAHDLKNPFTSLLGSSELLFENLKQLDPEKIRKLAIILNDSAKSGYAILQNLLDWSRSQTGMLKINPEFLNLKSLVDENIQNQELSSTNKEIELQSFVSGDIEVYADKNMVHTVLRNLISNAIKFSYRGSKVTVTASPRNGEVVVGVKDYGTGIAKDEIEKLFRIDAKSSLPGTENEQGTGLGLKLCKEFVEKQGGKLWVNSEENKGSEFMFSIAVEPAK